MLAAEVYKLTISFPREEVFGIVTQMRKAAVAVPSNIAEGHRRGSNKEFTQFLKIARGSLAELETQIIVTGDVEFIAGKKVEELSNEIEEIGKMINGLINSLSKD